MLCFARPSLQDLFAQLRNLRQLVLYICYITVLTAFSQCLFAQTGDATLSGTITDTSGAFVSDVRVTITNQDTGVSADTRTNKAGIYNEPGLKPGRYRVFVEKEGFKQVDLRDLTLNVQDVVSRNFSLEVGGTSETIQVDGSRASINTTDASVGTVIDRQFVQNIPLNGRSFDSLVLLSPGVQTESPQGTDEYGEFSVNGQRATANVFILDGASAMNAPNALTYSAGPAGALASTTALGTTQGMLSVDALQEFRIATSTYSAEFGRLPGAQVIFTSRSGTNQYHGNVFEYLRNYAFDANNWFNDYTTPALVKPPEKTNDFGGVIGGPISIPSVFSGKDRAFWFFSYEGLRLQNPIAATVSYVPSNGTFNTANYSNPLWENLRANAAPGLKTLVNGFPLPNCSVAQNRQCVDHGDGLSPFIYSGVIPANIDAISTRFDYQPLPWLRTFARYSDTESTSGTLTLNTVRGTQERNRVFLVAADSTIHGSIVDQLRLQYSPAYIRTATSGNPLNGEQSLTGQQGGNLWSLQGIPVAGFQAIFLTNFPGGQPLGGLAALSVGSRQFQPDVVNTVSWLHGSHLFKTGVDYRQTTSYFDDGSLSTSPYNQYFIENANQILTNQLTESVSNINLRQDPTAKNLGLFFQDDWRVSVRLSVSLGLRWDLNPPPSISGAQEYTYTGNINNPSSLALAPLGTPLYKTSYTDFGPRFGLAAILNSHAGHELVLRGGAGLYYDSGQSASYEIVGYGFGLGAAQSRIFAPGSGLNQFPLPASVIKAPPTVVPPYVITSMADPHFVPPSTVEWSGSLEQAFGTGQSVTIGYVGSEGRNLADMQQYSLAAFNPLFASINEYENGPGSSYNALQVQYKRQPLHGLQALASYTWAHAIDSDSQDYTGSTQNGGHTFLLQRGNSSHDVRSSFTGALVYNVPAGYPQAWQRAVLGNWVTDLWFVARTAFPVEPVGPTVIDPTNGLQEPSLLAYNGQNPYLHVKGIPGGRQFNPAVFSVAAPGQVNGIAPRDFLRGFGENEADLAVERVFPLYEQVHLQFRTEAFNLFNHPNFGAINVSCGATTPDATCNNAIMGQSTGTLSNASLGGPSSLFQHGGPRSLQFALKLQF